MTEADRSERSPTDSSPAAATVTVAAPADAAPELLPVDAGK